MSTTPAIEYAATRLHAGQVADVASKLRNAPAWVRSGAAKPRPATAPPATPRAVVRSTDEKIGWLVGTVCPGLSTPCESSADNRRLREQFTPAAWRSIVRQAGDRTKPVPISWGHGGPVLSTTRDLDVLVWISSRVGNLVGPEFQIRLPRSKLGEQVLERAGDGVGVSLGYYTVRQWIADRDGGAVRVVDELRLDHVSILPPDGGAVACFEAARAFSARGRWMAPPADIVERAHVYAWPILKRQAGIRA